MSQTPPPPPPPAAPPPPPAGPSPGGASNAPFSVGDAVGYGWNAYWKNVGPMILIVLAIWAVNLVFSLISLPFDNQFVRFFISLVGTVIGFVLCIIPGIIFLTFFGFYGFVIVDQDEKSPIAALTRSKDLVSGHFGAVLGLAVVLLLINIVGALLCGVGLLFTIGITAIAWAYAYRALRGQSVAPVQ